MKNFVRDNPILWVVKIAAALFQIPATFHVFSKILEEAGRGKAERYFTAFLAVILIDALIIVVMYFLESKELSPLDKLAWAFGGVSLLVAVFFIGFQDEGIMSFAPRIGVFLLVSIDLFAWVTEFSTFYFSREQIEKRLRNKQVLFRNKQDKKAWREARKIMYPEIVELQMQREKTTLGLLKESTSVSEPLPTLNIKENSEYIEEVEPGIYQVTGNGYGWIDAYGELHTQTALGKSYTLQGARSALKRAKNAV